MVDVASYDIPIPATDGYALAATVFEPIRESSKTVLIAPATGVRRRVYQDYASYLSNRGFTVVTWDWRGIGDSQPESLQGFHATMRDWAELDLVGVIEWAKNYRSQPISAIGHSFGGQSFGLASNRSHLQRLLTITTQSGYWGLWPSPARYKYAFMWYVLMPFLSRLVGWFPAKKLGFGEDIPFGVALEWSRWCRSPEYMGDYSGYRSFKAPMLALNFTDDDYAPVAAVNWLHAKYGSPAKEVRHLTPEQLGIKKAGHFGFFRKGLMPELWEETAEWLARGD